MIGCDCQFVVEDLEGLGWETHYETCRLKLMEREKNGEFPTGLPRNSDGTLNQINKHLKHLESSDYLYHLNMGIASHDFEKLFGDVKFVCMGGTSSRMRELAEYVKNELKCELPYGSDLIDLTASSNRYSMYKIGPVLAVNHGIGCSTLSVVLSEIIKLMQYSKAKDPIFIRIGTSGGIGVEPGTVVISENGYDGMLNNTYDIPILGKMVSMPAILDRRLAQELQSNANENGEFKTLLGNTMAANDFYIGQGRLDGPFCDYEEQDKMIFLKLLNSKGIINIEMEVNLFAAFTYKAGIKGSVVCVTIVNRLEGDQVHITKEQKIAFERRPMIIVTRYMKQYLKNINRYPFTNSL